MLTTLSSLTLLAIGALVFYVGLPDITPVMAIGLLLIMLGVIIPAIVLLHKFVNL